MRVRTNIWAIVLAIVVLQLTAASAQSPDVRRDLASALRVIRPLVRDDPERAIKMLEALNEEYPSNSQLLVLLGEAHRIAGNTEAAMAAYEKCLSFHPTHLQSGAALGVLHIQNDDKKTGEKVFADLFERTEHGVNTYRSIASTLSRNGYVDMALRYYEEGRTRNNNNYILTLDIAYLYKSMGRYKESLIEYLYVVEVNPKQQRLVKGRINELLRDADADTEELIAVLEKEVKRESAHRGVVMEILATTYLDRGMLERAIDMAILADETTGSNGGVLFRLAEAGLKEYERQTQSEKSSYFDLTLRALEAFLSAHPDSPQVPGAKLMLIELLLDLASGAVQSRPSLDLESAVVRALDALDWLIESFPGTDYAEQAYLKKGDLVFRVQNQPENAKAIYKEGMETARFYRAAFAERLGRVYLITEEYDEASRHFTILISSNNEELRETGIFYSALMLSFTGEYESARDTLTSLAEQNPASQFANDAIELAWILEEGLQGEQSVLKSYTRALQLELSDDTTRVLVELEKVSRSSIETPLRGRSLIRMGELYQSQEKNKKALKMYETFVADYPDDMRVADVQRKIGQVYETGYDNMEVALKQYEDILISYPYYIFLDEVRDDVTRIREQMGKN